MPDEPDQAGRRRDAVARAPGAEGSTTCGPLPVPAPPRPEVGRGQGSKGKTAGRGTKGTRARGGNVPARFEGGQMPLHMRLPKLKGFTNPFRTEYQVVNTGRLAELFPRAAASARRSWSRRAPSARDQPVKVLGTGDLTVALQVSAHTFSGAAGTRSPPPEGAPPDDLRPPGAAAARWWRRASGRSLA